MILSKEQLAVVNHCFGNAVVVAGAGSGKTKCLIERCAKLIENGVPPESILIFTFTKKAASEITERLVARLGEEGAAVTTCTIHSLALRIMREHFEDLGYTQKPTIWSSDRITRLCNNSFQENIKSINPNLSKSIKSYNKKMKKYKPEDDPMGFLEAALEQDKRDITSQLHSLKLMLAREFGSDDLDSEDAEDAFFDPIHDKVFPKTKEMSDSLNEEEERVRDFYFMIDKDDPEDVRKIVFKTRKKSIAEKIKEQYRPIPTQISGIELRDIMDSWREYETYHPEEEGVLKVAYAVLQAKQACSAIEFDDMIPGAIRALRLDPCNPYLSKFNHVMVDEYQDVNQENVDFIRLLATNSDSLMVVGDDDQSIYAFRGGNTKHILNFPKQFNAETLYLTTNYRCKPSIVHDANKVVMKNEDRFDKEMNPFRTEENFDEPVQFISPKTIYGYDQLPKYFMHGVSADFKQEIYSEIYSKILELTGFLDVKESEIAILARNNFQILQFEVQMKRMQMNIEADKRIKFQKMSGGTTFSNAVVEIFHNWFNFIINKTDIVSLQEALIKSVKGFGQTTSSMLADACNANPEGNFGDWLGVLFEKSRYGEDKAIGKSLRRILKVYNSIVDDIENMNVYEIFRQVIKISGIHHDVYNNYLDVIEKDLMQNISKNTGGEKKAIKDENNKFKMYFTLYEYDYAIRRLIGMIETKIDPMEGYDPEDPFAIPPSEEELEAARILNEQNKADITEFYGVEGLTKWMDTIKTEEEALSKKEGGVSMGTIHSSKGKEWDAVFVIGMTADIMPSPRNVDIDEERRLMYVAMTRAKDNLYVCWEKEMGVSPFVLDFVPEEQKEDLFINPYEICTDVQIQSGWN